MTTSNHPCADADAAAAAQLGRERSLLDGLVALKAQVRGSNLAALAS